MSHYFVLKRSEQKTAVPERKGMEQKLAIPALTIRGRFFFSSLPHTERCGKILWLDGFKKIKMYTIYPSKHLFIYANNIIPQSFSEVVCNYFCRPNLAKISPRFTNSWFSHCLICTHLPMSIRANHPKGLSRHAAFFVTFSDINKTVCQI